MNSREATIALNMLPQIGPIKVQRLVSKLGSPEAVLSTPPDILEQIKGIGPSISQTIAQWEDLIDLSHEIHQTKQRGIHIITKEDAEYPTSLRESYDPPLCLYVWGDILPTDNQAIAMVGSRRTTHYGRSAAHKIAIQLANHGYTIVSGLARGIDTFSHEGALAGKGRTIAVIGSGLAKIYPPENMTLAQTIASGHGAVVSEFPLFKAPDKKTFPTRNRIVAAWSRGVVVVESPSRSGSLITANLANNIGRPIYAVPGQIDQPLSAGCHQLIRDGATLVTDASQIHDDLHNFEGANFIPFLQETEQPNKIAPPHIGNSSLSQDQHTVLQALANESLLFDQIVETCQLPASSISSSLLILELQGHLSKLPGARYCKKQPLQA